jgi:lipopolysaccharide export system permease protein
MNNFNIINRYIFKELVTPFVISLFFLTFVFLMTRIPEIANMVVNYNVNILSVGSMLLYMLPRFLEFIIPMSIMISVLLTFMRMSGENEIMALKSAGVTLYQLLPPVLSFCLIGVLLTMWVTVFGVSWGKLSLTKITLELAETNMDMAFQERQFNSEIDDVMIYISHVDMKTKKLSDVFIEDRRTKGMVSISVAPFGELIKFEDDQVYTLRLFNGVINQVDLNENSVNNINFGSYDINFDLKSLNGEDKTIKKKLDERSLTELIQFIESNRSNKELLKQALMKLHEKFSIPIACLSLGLLAFPLGIQSNSHRKSSGFGLGISFFLLYYLLLAFGWSFGETRNFPPFLAMWLPNVIMGGIGLYILIRNAKEQPILVPQVIKKIIFELKLRWIKKV